MNRCADPARYFRDNVAGGIALLEAAREVGVDRVVFSSTAAVYGVPDATPIPEDATLRPINPYGESKRAFEGALVWYGRAYGLRSVTLRYFNVAGATERLGEDHDPETHLIPTILAAVEAGRPMTLFGDDVPDPGRDVHPRLHPRRRTSRTRTCARSRRPSPAIPGPPNRWSATSGTAAGSATSRFSPRPDRSSAARSRTRSGRRRPGDPPILVAAADRAAEVLGWRPRHPTLEEMVGSTWAWRQAHPGGYAD